MTAASNLTDVEAGQLAVSDHELLSRFVAGRDERAMAMLVSRHYELVWGVCRRALSNDHDVEDALQATFLVLVRDAAKIRRRESLTSWLYGVAYRTAMRARRRKRERSEAPLPPEATAEDDTFANVAKRFEQQLLDEELNRLPERYRGPLVLRYLMGRTNRQVAKQLNVSVGVVEGRLKRGRDELRVRLARRGVTLSALLATLHAGRSVFACGEPVVTSTVEAAMDFTGSDAGSGYYSQEAAALAAEELTRMSHTTSLTIATFVLLALAGVLYGQDDAPATIANTMEPAALSELNDRQPEPANRHIPIRVAQAGAKVAAKASRAAKGDASIQTLLVGRSRIDKLQWVDKGRALAFGGYSNYGVDGSQGAEIYNLAQDQIRELQDFGSSWFVLSRDGATLATADRVQRQRIEFKLWNAKSGELKKTISVQPDGDLFQARSLEYSQEGNLLAFSGFHFGGKGPGQVLLVDTRSGELRDLQPDRSIYASALSADGKMLATGHLVLRTEKAKSGIRIWNTKSGELLREWPAKRKMVTGLAISPDGQRVASVGWSQKDKGDPPDYSGWEWDQHVSIHNIRTGKLERILKGHIGNSVASVAWSPDGKLVASGGTDKTVRVWDVPSGKLLRTLTGHRATVSAVAFSPDGKRLASGDRQKVVRIWDVSGLQPAE